jgi:hypothetical protein
MRFAWSWKGKAFKEWECIEHPLIWATTIRQMPRANWYAAESRSAALLMTIPTDDMTHASGKQLAGIGAKLTYEWLVLTIGDRQRLIEVRQRGRVALAPYSALRWIFSRKCGTIA